MPEPDHFWDFYWEVRLQELEDLGKREAILALSGLMRGRQGGQAARLLELGCGAGQIIGALAQAHAETPGVAASVGVDLSARAIQACRQAYPQLRFVLGDFTDPALLESLGKFDFVLLVNALHEVFSAAYDEALGETDVPLGKARVRRALALAGERLPPGGVLALFDGLEPPGDPQERLRIRFRHLPARRRFETFAREYRPFRITYHPTGDPGCIEISRRDFTRYIDKSIFLEKRLWQTERLESYQYFTDAEFREAFAQAGLEIEALRTLTVNYEKWAAEVQIETPGEDFPVEHIMILARKQ